MTAAVRREDGPAPSNEAANRPDENALVREIDRLRNLLSELREPGASIRLAVQILAGPLSRDLAGLPEDKRDRISSTLVVLESATRQLNHLLAMSTAKSTPEPRGSEPTAERPAAPRTDVLELLRRLEVLTVTRSSLPALVAIDAPAGLWVAASGPDLLRALGNLVENAIQASARLHPGPGPWTVEVRSSLREEDGQPTRVVIEVVDRGGGLPAPLQAWLESRPVDETASSPHAGRGLPAARALIEGANGRLRARVGGEGTVFEVELPLAQP